MPAEELPAASRSRVGLWSGLLVGAVALYVLSIGPVAVLTARWEPSRKGSQVIDTVYQPVTWLAFRAVGRGQLIAYQMWWLKVCGMNPHVRRHWVGDRGVQGIAEREIVR